MFKRGFNNASSFLFFVTVCSVALAMMHILQLSIQMSYQCSLFKIFSKDETIIDKVYSDVSSTGQEFNTYTDMLALIHIQKTSGMNWEFHILNNLEIWSDEEYNWMPICFLKSDNYECNINKALKPIYWNLNQVMSLDFHADFTETSNFLMLIYANRISYEFASNDGVVHLMTLLRNPVHRYISEYEDVRRGTKFFF